MSTTTKPELAFSTYETLKQYVIRQKKGRRHKCFFDPTKGWVLVKGVK